MTTELDITRNFQQKMFDRIREDLGNLMPEEEIKKLLDAAMQKAFFEPFITKSTEYPYRETFTQSHFIKLIQEEMENQIKDLMKEWLETHKEEVSKLVKETLEGGITTIIVKWIELQMQGPLFNLQSELARKGIIQQPIL